MIACMIDIPTESPSSLFSSHSVFFAPSAFYSALIYTHFHVDIFQTLQQRDAAASFDRVSRGASVLNTPTSSTIFRRGHCLVVFTPSTNVAHLIAPIGFGRSSR
ncbi:hypothetical protein HGRIS_006917 [Hohenbuehelia grisea]|uniref:Uncharacterized protein n=1 Tax=Hohenbuehelia grisea TaxID=104357 RepID=A0ABR3JB64_9AGAR